MTRFNHFVQRRTGLLAILALGLMGGLAMARFGWATNLHVILAAAVALYVCWVSARRWLWLVVIILGVNLGLWRGQTVMADYQQITTYYGQNVEFSGRVEDDPIFTPDYQTEFHLADLISNPTDHPAPRAGRLKIRGFVFSKLNRGDRVEVSGVLKPSIGNRQGQIYYAQVNITDQASGWLESLRKRFFAGIYTALPEPQGSLGIGFLVGLRALLPTDLQHQLSVTGLTHIVAVSGFNLTILIRFTRRAFARFSKYIATVSSLGLIGAFLAVTGLAPSVFRASLVAMLALGAWYYGRPIKASVLILLPAAITALLNPNYLWADIGWYLSFLAFFGVLVIAPLIAAGFKHKPSSLIQILIETLSAQLMAVPLIIYVFGQLSIIAPLANIIILPLIPLTMLLVFISGIGGMLLPTWTGWLAWPATQVLTFMVETIRYLGGLSFASINIKFSLGLMLWVYGFIMVGTLLLRRKFKHRLDSDYSVVK